MKPPYRVLSRRTAGFFFTTTLLAASFGTATASFADEPVVLASAPPAAVADAAADADADADEIALRIEEFEARLDRQIADRLASRLGTLTDRRLEGQIARIAASYLAASTAPRYDPGPPASPGELVIVIRP